MNAVAITDFCNLFAVVKFFQAAISYGIKPLIGCEILWHTLENKDQCNQLTLLCQMNWAIKI